MSAAAPLVWTLPWIVPPVVALWRARRTASLNDFSADATAGNPFVSVIIPARNERRNIERCVRSVLSTTYPAFEVIIVDDHSTDGTGPLARHIATTDDRLRVLDAPPLPSAWFGKQWACAAGASDARGDLLLFTDADTAHAPDLLPRAVNALRARDVDLLSVAGHQEMHSFWERVVQPQMFSMLSMRYGGGEHVSNTRRPENAIANGQFMLMRRDAYAEIGGHARVRDVVAEDLALAQAFVREGRRIALIEGIAQMSTHMYASLSELVRGWRKNIYAGGRYAMWGGRAGRTLYPLVLLSVPLTGLAPVAALLLSALGLLSSAWLVWSSVVVLVSLGYWAALYRFMGEPARYALVYPIGLLVLLYIAVGAIVRGRRVEWKSREYQSG